MCLCVYVSMSMYLFYYLLQCFSEPINTTRRRGDHGCRGIELLYDLIGCKPYVLSAFLISLLSRSVLILLCLCSLLSLDLLHSNVFEGNGSDSKVAAACAHMLSTNPLISYLVVDHMYDCY